MNRVKFLKAVQDVSSTYSEAQLQTFLHEIGKVVPEGMRDVFLDVLRSTPPDVAYDHFDENDTEKFNSRLTETLAALEKIENGELHIRAYVDDDFLLAEEDDQQYFVDDQNIDGILQDTCDFIHLCTDQERYAEGAEIGDLLLHIQVQCVSENGDEEFSLHNLISYSIVHVDLAPVIRDILHCMYYALPLELVPRRIYEIISTQDAVDISVQDLMYHGREMENFDSFLSGWLAFLGEQKGAHAEHLLMEALESIRDPAQIVKYARGHVETHPGIVLRIIQDRLLGPAELLEFGEQAIRRIDRKYIIRSEIALALLEVVRATMEDRTVPEEQKALSQQRLEDLYFVAFESDTTPTNYLKALLHIRPLDQQRLGSAKRGRLRAVIQDVAARTDQDAQVDEMDVSQFIHRSELRENLISFNTLYVLKFLDGEFQDILESGRNEEESMGGPGSFIKQSIALFLLYLFRGKTLECGINNMLFKAQYALNFSRHEYEKELGIQSMNAHLEEEELFYTVFSEWKKRTVMTQAVQTEALENIMMLLIKKVAKIVKENLHEASDEYAAFIAAIGEVCESRGMADGKQKIMMEFRSLCPRKMVFRSKLREYGWLGE